MPCSKPTTFLPNIKELNSFATDLPNGLIKDETMFFNSDLDFAYQKGGPITKSFIDHLPNDWRQDVVFDSRVHMLMPDWFPAIPGWHHDDVPRPTATSQPDYDNLKYKSEHILGIVNAEICPTQFINTPCKMPAVFGENLIYRQWHHEIESLIAKNELTVIDAKDRTLIYFDWATFHTGIGARKNGWRWFGRVSRNTERVHSITNEIRVNAQVYLKFPMQGW